MIFGVSDGLVSNLALVMGVAGAATAAEPRFILLAGIAGLLAGSFSMAAGEYISMQSQRELFERQIALERAEMEAMPDEEEAELAATYRSQGVHRRGGDPHRAPHLPGPGDRARHARPRGAGARPRPARLARRGGASGRSRPSRSARRSRSSRSCSASGTAVLAVSLGLSLVALFAVGAAVSLLTGRGLLFSGARQLAIGLAAALVTFAIGSIIGVAA